MSGLCAVWRRDGAPVGVAAFEQMLAVTHHRAVDGCHRWVNAAASVVMAHQHFWVTPEEVGEQQPCSAGEVVVSYDGRLDNRAELMAALSMPAASGKQLSDAALVLRAYEQWGEGFAARLAGPFTVVLWDGRGQRLLCARDRLGLRSLFYHIAPSLLLAASEAGAVLAWPGTDEQLDEVSLAHHFALRPLPAGRSLFRDVQALPPAHLLVVDADGVRLQRYWSLDVVPLRYASDDDYAEHFREILDRAVQRRLRVQGDVGVMMSGGLDSPSVTALAAHQRSASPGGARLKVFSYVFDELATLDERRWMAPMVARYNLDQTLVGGDDAWPLSDYDRWRWNPSGPDDGPFRPLNILLFGAAEAAGVRVLLTGASSDGLFAGASAWLADLVADRRYGEAASEIWRYVRQGGLRRVLRSRSLRRLAASLVGWQGRPPTPPPWLTERAVALLDQATGLSAAQVSAKRPADVRAVLDSLGEDDGAGGGYGGGASAVDVRDPFSDLELAAFTLAIPAYLSYNQGSMKWILRRAMRSLVPDEILQRKYRSDISPLYRRGLYERGAPTVRALLGGSDDLWRRYVRPDWLSTRATSGGGAGDLVIWRCVTLQWWLNQRPSKNAYQNSWSTVCAPLVSLTAVQ